MDKKFIPDKRVIKGTSLTGVGDSGNPSLVEIKDGRVIRIRPFNFVKDFRQDVEKNKWTIEARGRKLSPPDFAPISPFGLTYKTRVYSKNRVRYPLKRVDWDPEGERNPQNRGISKYVRISWDEAAEICAKELMRIRDKYGSSAILVESDGHGEGKHVSFKGCPNRLVGLVGPYTVQVRNMDSWEGWHLGARHVWGCEPLGEMSPSANLYPDICENSDTVLYWGCDSEVTPLGITSFIPTHLSYFMTTIGIRSVFIDPAFNYAAAAHADKWIPVLPNTDAAFQLAIAYTWLKEGTYKKDYIEKHSYGFDKFVAYVMGDEDGVPKTPEWASEKCGVPEWTIKAFARKWAKDKTSILHGNGGGLIRGPYSSEPGRLEVMLLGMQGLGGPGVHQAKMLEWDVASANDWAIPYQPKKNYPIPQIGNSDNMPALPEDLALFPWLNIGRGKVNPEMQERAPRFVELTGHHAAVSQCIPRCLVNKALLEDHIEWYGCAWAPVRQNRNMNLPTPHLFSTAEAQFTKYEFPRPGCSRIHMIWTDTPCNVTCWNGGNAFIEGYRSPEVETIIAQHPWLENDCLFADIILPVATKFEMNDLGNDTSSGTYVTVYREDKCVDIIGESKDDFWACAEVAKHLGPDYYERFTSGLTEDELVRELYKASGIEELITWEELEQRQMVFIPKKDEEEIRKMPPGLRVFHDDSRKYHLTTPSGLLEYSSLNMERKLPEDAERPPVPHWIEKGPSHDERLSGERGKKYTLLIVSNHGRWRMHAQCDDMIWSREVETMKIRGKDGYAYEPCWMNPAEAEKRGIKTGDIVKVFNDRGIVLCGAYVTERVPEKTCYVDHGSRLDPIIPGWLDRGGAINTICPVNNTSANATGMATTGYLVEVEKVSDGEMKRWKKDYPEAFARKTDPACGLCLEGWLEDPECIDY